MRRILASALLVVWAREGYANPQITLDLPDGVKLEMVYVEPGTFTMGNAEGEAEFGYYQKHTVTISKGYYLGKYEITQGQWTAVTGTRPWSGERFVEEKPDNPAVYISWEDLQDFIGKLNDAEGAPAYRLPTEAEWEYACRAGTTTAWSFGDDENQLKDYAWYNANTWNAGLQSAQPVGTKLPNPWGLFDMHGNVWELVQDRLADYPKSAQIDPQGPTSDFTGPIWRGGDYRYAAHFTQSATRDGSLPNARHHNLGARLVRQGPSPSPTLIDPESWGKIKINP